MPWGRIHPLGTARQEALHCRAQRRDLTADPKGALMGAKGASLPKQKTWRKHREKSYPYRMYSLMFTMFFYRFFTSGKILPSQAFANQHHGLLPAHQKSTYFMIHPVEKLIWQLCQKCFEKQPILNINCNFCFTKLFIASENCLWPLWYTSLWHQMSQHAVCFLSYYSESSSNANQYQM